MWVGSPPVLKEVGVWVVVCGVQGDAPMRQLLSRGLGATAERGCDECGILARKGKSNATKYTGYIKPCDVDVRDRDGAYWGPAKGWASGAVVNASNKRPFRQAEPVRTHFLTGTQVEQRDKGVDAEIDRLRESNKRNPAKADREIEKLVMKEGSRGQSEFARAGLGYWHTPFGHPTAAYHTTYLGPGKDKFRYLNVRLGVGEKPKEDLVLPISHPKALKGLLHARRLHFVLRNKPDCIMVDFTAHLGSMSMSEMQLLYEVGVPYLVHDLPAFGVHPAVGVMLLLLRHGMMCFTRLMCTTQAEYATQLKLGTACLFAYGAIAEHFHGDAENGLSQFPFTWKLHKLQHMERQVRGRCFPTESSDAWVERLMRHKASMILKCVHRPVLLHAFNCFPHACALVLIADDPVPCSCTDTISTAHTASNSMHSRHGLLITASHTDMQLHTGLAGFEPAWAATKCVARPSAPPAYRASVVRNMNRQSQVTW